MTNLIRIVNAIQAVERVMHHTARLEDKDAYHEAIKLHHRLQQLKYKEEQQ